MNTEQLEWFVDWINKMFPNSDVYYYEQIRSGNIKVSIKTQNKDLQIEVTFTPPLDSEVS